MDFKKFERINNRVKKISATSPLLKKRDFIETNEAFEVLNKINNPFSINFSQNNSATIFNILVDNSNFQPNNNINTVNETEENYRNIRRRLSIKQRISKIEYQVEESIS